MYVQQAMSRRLVLEAATQPFHAMQTEHVLSLRSLCQLYLCDCLAALVDNRGKTDKHSSRLQIRVINLRLIRVTTVSKIQLNGGNVICTACVGAAAAAGSANKHVSMKISQADVAADLVACACLSCPANLRLDRKKAARTELLNSLTPSHPAVCPPTCTHT